MPLTIIIVKVVGAALLGWTVYSIVKHIRERRRNNTNEQSITESLLNNLLLYLWLAFMVVFSSGMILNN
jgi:threonine/homoserine/homoserine lactone efflux protein